MVKDELLSVFHQFVGRGWRGSGVFIVNFEHDSHLVPKFLLLILNM